MFTRRIRNIFESALFLLEEVAFLLFQEIPLETPEKLQLLGDVDISDDEMVIMHFFFFTFRNF